jgi:hypothetical protein
MECEDVFRKVKVELGGLSIPPLTVFKTIYGMGVVRVIKGYSGGGGRGRDYFGTYSLSVHT